MIFRGSLKRSLDYQAAVRMRRKFLFYDGDESVYRRPGFSRGKKEWGIP